MIRKILFLLVVTSFSSVVVLQAEPTPSPKAKVPKSKTVAASESTPAVSLPGGWSNVNGVWTHPDGYQFIRGQVVRVGKQTHKKPPQPPTKAQIEATVKKPAPKAPVDAAAAKAAERERNLAPRPAPQTGTHL